MICAVLEVETTVQVGDKTRLSASKTFVTKGEAEVSKVEIDPDGSGTFIDVTGDGPDDWYLDWIFSGISRTVSPVLRVTTDGSPVTATKNISVVTAADDMLFSTDKDLMTLEPDVMKYVPDGRASWLAMHRAAQEKILDAIAKMGILASDGTKITKAQVLDVDEVRFWSRDLVLSLIFLMSQNSKDDFFAQKAKHYADEADSAKERAVLKLDLNKDGTQGNFESYNMTARNLVRE